MRYFSVIEVANGDYGDMTPELVKAAAQSETLPLTPVDEDHLPEEVMTPVIKMEAFIIVDDPYQKEPCIPESKEIYRVPSEWSKFWTLVARCQVYYYRDWVSLIFHLTLSTLQ